MNKFHILWAGVVLLVASGAGPLPVEDSVTDIGSQRELFVDRHHIASQDGVRLVLHHPRREEIALRFDSPWDGPYSAYVTVFRDGDLFRMYYRGWADLKGMQVTCYAESRDGIHWDKPDLGLVEFEGSRHNNIILMAPGKEGTHNFAPFKDDRPGVPDDQRYKAVGGGPLYAYASPDGIHWRRLADEPVMTKGAFDSQNLAFWDPKDQRYDAYYRIFTGGVRSVATAHSDDFLHWTDPVPIVVVGQDHPEHFYTNATVPYFRAPQYNFMFPKRFVPNRKRLPEHPETGISDAVFLSSRDGLHFDRTFNEALIRPGRDPLNWGDRSNMPAWGLVQTGPDEMSIYFSQNYRYPSHHLRRGVFRLDGIASASAGGEPGELVTTPLRFSGDMLRLNYATSAAGSIRVEIQNAQGEPIPGYALADAPERYGDAIDESYTWKSAKDVSALKGQPVRLRFVLQDADLYAYRFGDPEGKE